MSLTKSLQRSLPSRWIPLPPQRGWVGVDIGTGAMKAVQLQRRGSKFRIAARWSLPLPRNSALTQATIASGSLQRLLVPLAAARKLFSTKHCAVALPMSIVDSRLFELPLVDARQQRAMIREELATDLGCEPSELAFDYWDTVAGSEPEMRRFAALSLPRTTATRVAGDLLSASCECQVLDAIPCALARAVQIGGDGTRDSEPIAAVDLAFSSPLLVIVQGGRPMFTRLLRGGSLQAMMQSLEQGLNLSREECLQLLSRYGVPNKDEPSSSAARAVFQGISNPLAELVSEIEKTIGYVRQEFYKLSPSRLCLFGGGAAIRNLPEHLSDVLRLSVARWRPSGVRPEGEEDALFGVAAGLSLLRWEGQPCT